MMQKMNVVKAGDKDIERREKYVTFGLNMHSLLWKGEEREVPREERENKKEKEMQRNGRQESNRKFL